MTLAPAEVARLAADHAWIEACLAQRGFQVPPYPALSAGGAPQGRAAARAYPIQGILKYHGLADWRLRTAYLPSISVNNDAAQTLTMVQFDPSLAADQVTINRVPADTHARERVVQMLDAVRTTARITTRARVDSRNFARATRVGKGLGTSASASAALALAALSATLGPTLATHERLLSCTARLLAGSGCRSAVGGVSLWLSYPGISHADSYALRLDRRGELTEMGLVTIPMDSRIGLVTEAAHREAPASPLFSPWCQSRAKEVVACVDAVLQGDWRTLARWAELDSIRLHAVTMTASLENKLFAWEPENIHLFRLCNELRASGVPVYFSTDTGPTMVLMARRRDIQSVISAVQSLHMGFETIEGSVAGPAETVPVDQAMEELEITA